MADRGRLIDALKSCENEIYNRLDPKDILPDLCAAGIITYEQYSKLRKKIDRRESNIVLMELLMRQLESHQFEAFCSIIDKNMLHTIGKDLRAAYKTAPTQNEPEPHQTQPPTQKPNIEQFLKEKQKEIKSIARTRALEAERDSIIRRIIPHDLAELCRNKGISDEQIANIKDDKALERAAGTLFSCLCRMENGFEILVDYCDKVNQSILSRDLNQSYKDEEIKLREQIIEFDRVGFVEETDGTRRQELFKMLRSKFKNVQKEDRTIMKGQ